MYGDPEAGNRFLSVLPSEGGGAHYDIIPPHTTTTETANNANSAVGGISEVGMLPPVGYSIATGASFSIPLQAGSAHAQAMCGNRTGDIIYWLEAVTYVGAGTQNWGSYRVCRSIDYMKTAQIMGTYSSPEGQSIMVCNPRSLACNNDGTVLILPYLRGIGISRDGGATVRWVNLGLNPDLTIYNPEADLYFSEGQYICCSESGQYIYVVGRRNGYFAKSSNYFDTFSYTVPWVDGDNVHSSYGFIQRWDRTQPSGLTQIRTPETYDLAVSGICCSRDGRHVAVAQCLSQQTTPLYRGRVWVSDDFGFNFLTKVVTDCDAVYTYNYGAISMSESGQYIIVGHNYNFSCPANDSRLHYSDNYGATFQTLNNSNAGLPLTKYAVSRIKGNADYKYIWMNDELSKFMAYSTNGGATWTIWSDTKDVDAAPVRRYDGMHVSAWGEHAYYIYNSTIRRIEMLPLIFGLASTADIGFDTNSTRRMTIKQDGKIGINTITPDEQLDVAGNVKLRGNVNINKTGAGSTLIISGDTNQQQNIQFWDTAARWILYKPSGTTNFGFYNQGLGKDILTFYAATNIIGFNGAFLPATTNQFDVGSSDYRVRTLYTTDIAVTGNIYSSTTSQPIILAQSNLERARINSSGQLEVKTATINTGAIKISTPTQSLDQTTFLGFSGDGTDGNDRARVGCKFGSTGGGNLFFTTGGSGTQIERMLITNTEVSISNNILPDATASNRDLGASARRFRDLYLVNSPQVSSDGQSKKDVVPLDTSQWLSIVNKLHPVSYKLINNESDRTHTGFISQQVEQDVGFELADRWGFYVKSTVEVPVEVPTGPIDGLQVGDKRKRDDAETVDVAEWLGEEEKKDGCDPSVVTADVEEEVAVQSPAPATITKEVYGLRYTELIAPLVACVQELNKRILLQQEQIQLLATQIAELKQGSAL